MEMKYVWHGAMAIKWQVVEMTSGWNSYLMNLPMMLMTSPWITIWWIHKLMKWQADEMTSCWND